MKYDMNGARGKYATKTEYKDCRKPDRKMALGGSRSGEKNSIKMAVIETGWEDVDCINLAQDKEKWRAVVNMAMNFPVP